MCFNPDIPVLSIVLFGAAALCLACVCAVYCRKLYVVRRQKAHDDATQADPDAKLPRASVVIFTRNEPEALQRNLPAMLKQDYPAGYEVVVVNDGASAETSMVVGELKRIFPNIYLTYTPDGARNLSRKKLALTLGVKAAKGEVVVITDASTIVPSDQWLKRLMQPMADASTGVVIGYGAPDYPQRRAVGRKRRIFDSVADAIAWLGAAIGGEPYRACGYCVAYRRQLFFDNKGFSRSLNLREGDDDIFINEIANDANTAVVLADDAMVKHEAHAFAREHADYRLSHHFTGRMLPKQARRLMALGEWCMCGVVAFGVAAAWVAGACNLFGWAVAALLIIGMWATVAVSWSRTLAALRAPSMSIAAPWLAMTRPMRNALLGVRSRLSHTGHYTWQ